MWEWCDADDDVCFDWIQEVNQYKIEDQWELDLLVECFVKFSWVKLFFCGEIHPSMTWNQNSLFFGCLGYFLITEDVELL